jgi:hypothetical protein
MREKCNYGVLGWYRVWEVLRSNSMCVVAKLCGTNINLCVNPLPASLLDVHFVAFQPLLLLMFSTHTHTVSIGAVSLLFLAESFNELTDKCPLAEDIAMETTLVASFLVNTFVEG